MDGRTDGGDCNIHDAFLKKRGDKDAVKMCKTKCLVYFIAIRSPVSKLLEEKLIIDPFSMCESCH